MHRAETVDPARRTTAPAEPAVSDAGERRAPRRLRTGVRAGWVAYTDDGS